jgi:hypothetical protein
MQAAVDCMRDTEAPRRERLAAIAMILDRAWGRPKETIQLDGEGVVYTVPYTEETEQP